MGVGGCLQNLTRISKYKRMFTVDITKEQREYTWDLVKKHSFAHRGVFDGKRDEQYTGMLGQTVMSDLLGYERPDGKGGFDNGIDFVIQGKNVDLKTMGRHTDVRDYYVNNLVASQIVYATDFYVFASINKEKRTMTFIGILEKKNLEQYFHSKGEPRTRSDQTSFNVQTDMYEIPNKDLIPVNSPEDIVWEIDRRL